MSPLMRWAIVLFLLLALVAWLLCFGDRVPAPSPEATREQSAPTLQDNRQTLPAQGDSASTRTPVAPPASGNIAHGADDGLEQGPNYPQLDRRELEACREQLRASRVEVMKLRARVRWLESELATNKLEGPVGRWLATIPESERPSQREVRLMNDYLRDFGISELSLDEGRWLIERLRKDDWKTWGSTAEEAIMAYFGVARTTRGLSQARLAYLKKAYPHYFH